MQFIKEHLSIRRVGKCESIENYERRFEEEVRKDEEKDQKEKEILFRISENPIEKERKKSVFKFKERKCAVGKKDVFQNQRRDPKKSKKAEEWVSGYFQRSWKK